MKKQTKKIEEKQVVASKKYIFEIVHYSDGSGKIKRHNDGFSVIEMIGISAMIQKEMIDIISGKVISSLPTDIERSVVNDTMIHKRKG